MALEVYAYQYDDDDVFFGVKDSVTNRHWACGFETIAEAEEELLAIEEAEQRFNDGPFSTSQATA